MKKQLEQFALEIERHGDTLPETAESVGQFGRVSPARTSIEVAPGIRYGCLAEKDAARNLAAKIRSAKIPAKRTRPARGPRPDGDDLNTIMDHGKRYAENLRRNGHASVTLWPDAPKRACYRLHLERVILARLAGIVVKTKRSTRFGPPDLDLPGRAWLIDRAKAAGVTIKYADPDGIAPAKAA